MNEAIDVDESAPTEQELYDALGKLKNQKSPGIDKCPLEGLKYGRDSNRLMAYLVFMVGLIWSSLVVPKVWLEGKITCLYKKGSFSIAKNYRPITSTANLSRLIPMIILDRTKNAYTKLLEQCQCGFKPGSGCDDAIFSLRNVVENSGAKSVLIFIDFTSAYDMIPRKLMLKILTLRLGLPHFVALIQSIYTNTHLIQSIYTNTFLSSNI